MGERMFVNGRRFVSMTSKQIFKPYVISYFVFCSIIFSVSSDGEVSTFSEESDHGPNNFLTSSEGDIVIFDQIITILPMSTIPIPITPLKIPSGTRFLVIQVHAHNFNLTISYNQTLVLHYHVNGTNIGLVAPLEEDPLSEVYVTNFNASRNVSALIAAVAYGGNVPIPGGCNMVFPVETSPFLVLSYNNEVVRLDVQSASPPDNSRENCDTSSVELEIYHSYFPERDYSAITYFNTIRRMLTVDRIRNNGIKVGEPLEGTTMRRIFGAYTGTGSVYSVIAVYYGVNGRYESAYIPAATYACSAVLWANTCQVLTTTFAKVVCAVLFFMGLFMCLFGHIFFRSQIFMHSFLSGSFIAYIVFFPHLQYGLYPTSLCFGIALALILVFFWQVCALPLFHVIFISLNVGFLLASVIFYAGLGDVDIMDSNVIFWVSFSTFLLFTPVVLLYFSHKACIVASGVLGAYAVIVPIDHYIGSNLKFIILNIIRRATVPEFKSAVISPPYQFKDLMLTLVWCILAAVGISMQLLLQWTSPPFPPPPRNVCGIFKCFSFSSFFSSSRQSVNERTPLLVDARIPQQTPPDGYDDVFEPSIRPSAPSNYLVISH